MVRAGGMPMTQLDDRQHDETGLDEVEGIRL